MAEIGKDFYDRADAFINLANQLAQEVTHGTTSASFMYGLARYNAFVSACGFRSAEEMQNARAETIAYFREQYIRMLEENLDEYIRNFSDYTARPLS